MKIQVDIHFDAYTSLLAKLDLSARKHKHKQLKDALLVATADEINDDLVITILCELEEASALLEFAKKHCPEAVLDIATSINLIRDATN